MKTKVTAHNSNGEAIDWTNIRHGTEFTKFTATSDTVTIHGLYDERGILYILEEIVHENELSENLK